jgi:hypothetical protein
VYRSAPHVSITLADPILEGIVRRMIDTIPLNLQTGDLVTVHGVASLHKQPLSGGGRFGPENHLGLVVSMFRDPRGRYLANVEWLKCPRENKIGTYYNYRYATCTEWVGKLDNETSTENFSNAS